jgi:hypothetical protein
MVEPKEPRSQSNHVIPAQTSAVQPEQQTDTLPRHELKIEGPTYGARPTKEAHKPYPAGHLTTEPSHLTHIGRTEVAHHPVQESSEPGLPRRYSKQAEAIGRRGKDAIGRAVRIEKAARAVGMPSSNSARGGEPSKLDTRVVQGDPERIWPSTEIDEQTRPLGIPVSDGLGIQERAELKEPVSPGEQEWVRPLVRIGKPKGKSASPLSARMAYHRELGLDGTRSVTEPFFHRKTDLIPMRDVALMPGREQCKPFTENPAPRLATEPVVDSPTIQVTIGRVEIRATVASTPTRKAPAKSSAMSLDDYLTRRNEGHR